MPTDTAGSDGIEPATRTNVDAGVAAARRVKHLSAIVRESLGPNPNRETLVCDVVVELYGVHLAIGLEDGLELVQLIDPPTNCSTKAAIQTIVDEACVYLEEWGRIGPDRTETPTLSSDP
jgi:hypothetical protein